MGVVVSGYVVTGYEMMGVVSGAGYEDIEYGEMGVGLWIRGYRIWGLGCLDTRIQDMR